ncbi:MAG: hypothetical protein JST30_12215 [Armatimonadetes bacterium]|nr:hypothetical protein [Armatimonadota bacterium]
MRVIGLHKWPVSEEGIDADAEGLEPFDDWRAQIADNWKMAWLVVLTHDGPASDIDFSSFGYPPDGDATSPRDSWQAAWDEHLIEDSAETSTVAFFLHDERPSGTLYYDDAELPLPEPSDLPVGMTDEVAYSSPT